MKWFFLRHGEIRSNIRKVYAGWSDEGLTSLGIQQAQDAGLTLKDRQVDAILSSPLKRAFQTAEIIGGILNRKPIPIESFKELKMGAWEGLSEETILKNYPEQSKQWLTKPANLVIDCRETLHALQERVIYGIKHIHSRSNWKNIVVVSHVAIIRVVLLYIQHLDLNQYKTIPVPENGKIIEINGDVF